MILDTSFETTILLLLGSVSFSIVKLFSFLDLLEGYMPFFYLMLILISYLIRYFLKLNLTLNKWHVAFKSMSQLNEKKLKLSIQLKGQ